MEERVEKEIDKIGTIRYYNNKRQLHNENGPAIEYKISCSGKQKYKEWWINGILQKCEGWKIYYKKQQLTEYYVHGSLQHGTLKVIRYYDDGTIEHYYNLKLHREDGPAIIYPDGTEKWYLYGKIIIKK